MKNFFTIVIITSLIFFSICDEIFIKELELIQTLSKNIKNEQVEPKQRKMTINSDLLITGSLTANTITCESSKINGTAQISKLLKASEIKTDKLTTNTIITERIVSPTGILTLSGDLVINNDVSADSIEMKGTSLILDNVRQWGLVHHDDFETEDSLDGWSDKRLSRCKEGGSSD
jgi:hypothetical protein